MMVFGGILGAAALFVLLGYSATRRGTHLESGGTCHGGPGSLDSCSLQDDCDGCGHPGQGFGWWPTDRVKDGYRR